MDNMDQPPDYASAANHIVLEKGEPHEFQAATKPDAYGPEKKLPEKGEPSNFQAPTKPEAYGLDSAVTSQPPTAPTEVEPNQRPPIASLYSGVTEEDIREACLQYASEDCCYGSKFVHQMAIPEINNGYFYIYKLQSIAEKRQTYLEYTPYYGQQIDSPEFGPTPHPWDIPVAVPREFSNTHFKQEMPHTAIVQTCFNCKGARTVRCIYCYGSGTATCFSCDGTHYDSSGYRCSGCRGTGSQSCSNCSATGKVECGKCKARGQLKICTMLAVTWKVYVDEYSSATKSLPKELIQKEEVRLVFREEGYQVYPVTHSLDFNLNEASRILIKKQRRVNLQAQRIVKQEHHIVAVPFVTVKYQWKDRNGEFYLYGRQMKVYFTDYPQPCCCCTCL